MPSRARISAVSSSVDLSPFSAVIDMFSTRRDVIQKTTDTFPSEASRILLLHSFMLLLLLLLLVVVSLLL